MSLKQDKHKEIHVLTYHNKTTSAKDKANLESSQRKEHTTYGTTAQILEISHQKPHSAKEHSTVFTVFLSSERKKKKNC